MWNYEKRLRTRSISQHQMPKLHRSLCPSMADQTVKWEHPCVTSPRDTACPDRRVCGVLTDIGTEELAHLEMVASIVRQLTKGLSAEELEAADLHHIMSTIPVVSGHRRRAVFLLTPANFSPRVMPSPIFLKIWRQNRKRAPRMTIF